MLARQSIQPDQFRHIHLTAIPLPENQYPKIPDHMTLVVGYAEPTNVLSACLLDGVVIPLLIERLTDKPLEQVPLGCKGFKCPNCEGNRLVRVSTGVIETETVIEVKPDGTVIYGEKRYGQDGYTNFNCDQCGHQICCNSVGLVEFIHD